jgi:hypothetical protein
MALAVFFLILPFILLRLALPPLALALKIMLIIIIRPNERRKELQAARVGPPQQQKHQGRTRTACPRKTSQGPARARQNAWT